LTACSFLIFVRWRTRADCLAFAFFALLLQWVLIRSFVSGLWATAQGTFFGAYFPFYHDRRHIEMLLLLVVFCLILCPARKSLLNMDLCGKAFGSYPCVALMLRRKSRRLGLCNVTFCALYCGGHPFSVMLRRGLSPISHPPPTLQSCPLQTSSRHFRLG